MLLRRAVRLALLVLLLSMAASVAASLAASVAVAHGRSVSYSSWVLDEEGADVSLRLPLLELSRLGPAALGPELLAASEGAPVELGSDDALAAKLARELTLIAGDVDCPRRGRIRRFVEPAGWVRLTWRVDCPTGAVSRAIESRILLDVAPSHLHFARVRSAPTTGRAEHDAVDVGSRDHEPARESTRRPIPAPIREQVLTEASPRFVVRSAGDAPDAVLGGRIGDYLRLGIDHIVTGWDHLAFLLGLVLLARGPREIARLVTGFTLAHSLTLALTVLGLVHPRADAVEAVIAYSVALVAAEAAWHASGRGRAIPLGALVLLAGLGLASAAGPDALPPATTLGLMLFTACHFATSARSDGVWHRTTLTFAFGLVHGFGFAGILMELELPRDRLVPALAGFNFGVELGQLAIVLLLWPALARTARWIPESVRIRSHALATSGLCGLGCFWLYVRALGVT